MSLLHPTLCFWDNHQVGATEKGIHNLTLLFMSQRQLAVTCYSALDQLWEQGIFLFSWSSFSFRYVLASGILGWGYTIVHTPQTQQQPTSACVLGSYTEVFPAPLPLVEDLCSVGLILGIILDPRIFSVLFPESDILLLTSSRAMDLYLQPDGQKVFQPFPVATRSYFYFTKSSGSLSGFWGWEGVLLILRRVNFCIMRERSRRRF